MSTEPSQQGANKNQSLPLLVTELFDPSKIQMIQRNYRGILEILASDVFITRCMAQNVRHPGLSYLFYQILSHGYGNSIHIRTFESFAGPRFGDLTGASPKAILLGVVRPDGEGFRSILNPSGDLILESEDRLVFLAQAYEDCKILKNPLPKQSPAQSQGVSHIQAKSKRRILILGWNHKVVALIKELDDYLLEQFEISILSLIPSTERDTELERKGIDRHRVRIDHYEGDQISPSDLEALHPSSYDNVVILGSDWLETQEESDARTIVGHIVLKDTLEGTTQKPEILVDLMDADNVGLFQDENTEVLVTPMMVSHVLAQVALRRELNVVYAELFGAGGAEIFFRPVANYGIVGQQVSFGKLKDISVDRGEIVLGIRSKNNPIELNPAQNKTYILKGTDDLIVLVREAAA